MRIDSNVIVSQIAPITREGKQATRATEGQDGPASVVSLSSAAGTAGTAATEKPSQGVTARLAAIRSSIESGTYPIDLDRLASRIVDDDLIRGTKS